MNKFFTLARIECVKVKKCVVRMVDHKNILITGASSGIGAEIAQRLSGEGYRLFLAGRNEKRLKEMAQKVSANGYFAGDLIEDNVVNELFQSAKDSLGVVDILINSAGEYLWGPVEKMKKEDIDRVFKLNLQVPYELCSSVVVEMKQQKWGRIVNIGSISGAVGEANASLYSASKAGLIGFTKALALELAEYGITINVVNPGWVKTPLTENAIEKNSPEEQEQLCMIPQGRFICPEEISAMVQYLLSEEARGLTGQSLNLCAGLSLG